MPLIVITLSVRDYSLRELTTSFSLCTIVRLWAASADVQSVNLLRLATRSCDP